ncbi:hypothetical protein CAL7716_071810 [Calothrix sp. PCC 7716]|nr:hypothetical protein CAL7716_071810 [Calothrix sp. PCC 7716]
MIIQNPLSKKYTVLACESKDQEILNAFPELIAPKLVTYITITSAPCITIKGRRLYINQPE